MQKYYTLLVNNLKKWLLLHININLTTIKVLVDLLFWLYFSIFQWLPETREHLLGRWSNLLVCFKHYEIKL